mgnify:CR=1 FL=1
MAGQNISHEGHRQRMRARVEQYGLESLAPHEALEYLLYITNARRDTNGIAHALLERFGSFAGVLEASEEELCRVPDVVSAALRGGTESVVLCHNHPNGVPLPSREDLAATENIVRALGLVKIRLRDHIILAENDYFSMRESNRLPFYDFETGAMLRPYGRE